MANIHTLNIRPSDFVLDRVLNPAADRRIGSARPGDIIEACGIIPDFFCAACIMASNSGEPVTLDAIADDMDAEYQMGGFCYPFGGSVDVDGTYHSEFADDPDMAPLARFGFDGRFFCYVYDYGIVAIRDGLDGPAKIARFD
jgi:hypothetical protein